MKKIIFLFLIPFLTVSSITYAQTVLLDFDEVNYDNWDGWNATITTIDNPVKDAVNSSDKVGHYFSSEFITEYGVWGLAWFDLPEGDNVMFGSSKLLRLKVLAPASGASMIIKLEDKVGGTEAPNISISASGYSPGSWEELTYNFSSANNGVYDRIVFLSSTHDTWDIDDLVIDDISYDPEIVISDDGEIKEGMEDGEIISVLLKNDTFVETLDQSNWLMNNLPTGVSKGTVTRIDSTHAEIALSGNATASYGGEDITNVAVAVKAGDLVKSESGLTAMTGLTFIAVPSGVNTEHTNEALIYPNPATDVLNISTSMYHSIHIYSICGKLIDEQAIISNHQLIDISRYTKGLYLVKLKSSDGRSTMIKLLKE